MNTFLNRKCISVLIILCFVALIVSGCKMSAFYNIMNNSLFVDHPIVQALDNELSEKNYSIDHSQTIKSYDGKISMKAPNGWFDATDEEVLNLSPMEEISLLNITNGTFAVTYKKSTENIGIQSMSELNDYQKNMFAEDTTSSMQQILQIIGGTLKIRDKKIFDNAVIITGDFTLLGEYMRCIYIYFIKNGYVYYVYGAANTTESYNNVICIIKSLEIEGSSFWNYFK